MYIEKSLRSLSSAHEKWGQKQKCCVYNFVQCMYFLKVIFYYYNFFYCILIKKRSIDEHKRCRLFKCDFINVTDHKLLNSIVYDSQIKSSLRGVNTIPHPKQNRHRSVRQ